MTKRTFLTASLRTVALAAWLFAPARAGAQHHGGGHAGGGHGTGGHAASFHASGVHSGGTAYRYGGWGNRGYYGRGYSGYWGGRRGYWGGYGWWPGFSVGLGLGLGGLGFYPGSYGYYPWSYGYYPGSYSSYGAYAPSYYGAYAPSYGDYYATPYVSGADAAAYAPQTYGSATRYGNYEPSPDGVVASIAPAGDNTAHIRVRVPADARVWFGDTATRETGNLREFESPPLAPDKAYTYDIRAQWREGSREVTQTRHIDVHAGDRVTVDFSSPSPDVNAAPLQSSPPPPPPQSSPPPPPRPPGS